MTKTLKIVIICAVSLVLLAILVFFVGSGFTKREDVFLGDFRVDDDGDEIDLYVGVSSSIGFVRDAYTKRKGDDLYVYFFSAFGGPNGRIDAEDVLDVDVDFGVKNIYFDRGNGKFEHVLTKNPTTGTWERVDLKDTDNK